MHRFIVTGQISVDTSSDAMILIRDLRHTVPGMEFKVVPNINHPENRRFVCELHGQNDHYHCETCGCPVFDHEDSEHVCPEGFRRDNWESPIRSPFHKPDCYRRDEHLAPDQCAVD